jgi:hypothetical protein
VLRVTFVAEGGEVTGEWRKLCSEELCDLCCSPSDCWSGQMKKCELGRACCMHAYDR